MNQFVLLSELPVGAMFAMAIGGQRYELCGLCKSTIPARPDLFVARRPDLDGRPGNYFVLENDRPVIAL